MIDVLAAVKRVGRGFPDVDHAVGVTEVVDQDIGDRQKAGAEGEEQGTVDQGQPETNGSSRRP